MDFWSHETCCKRDIRVGERYRRSGRDCTVTYVEPFRQNKIFCRAVLMARDDGTIVKAQVTDLIEHYQTIDNVVGFPARRMAC